MENSKRVKVLAAVYCVLIMLITGASDALRGVFLPLFKSEFSLSESQASMLIMISYVGNLLFLFIGGYLADRLPRKKFIGGLMLIWMLAIAVYIFTESYEILLVTIIFSLGASTMLSTSVNIITPLIFASPALFINVFNFCQGMGIAASQNIGGRFASKISSWYGANLIILCLAVLAFILLMTLKLPDPEPQKTGVLKSYLEVLKNPACFFLIALCGFYEVAEHGLQNWLTSYGSQYLGFTVSRSAFFLSLFFGGITLGRLIFAPLVQRLGTFKSLLIWTSASALLYIPGLLIGKVGMYLICASGLAFSILWPTLVLLVGKFYPKSISGIATGFIIGVSNIFDVIFNAFFGSFVQSAGYATAIKVLPVCAALFTILLFALRFCVKGSREIE